MGNIATLKPKPFTSENQPDKRGRPKGVRNRSTVLREILALERKAKNGLTNKTETMEVEKQMEIAIVQKALEGDVRAYNAVKDNAYGKLTDKVEVTDGNQNAKTALDFALELIRRDNFDRAAALEAVREYYPDEIDYVDGELVEEV